MKPFLLPGLVVLSALSALAAGPPPAASHRADRILIQPKRGVQMTRLSGFHASEKRQVLRTFSGMGHLQVVRVPNGDTVQSLIEKYQRSGLVEFAEPDYMVQAAAVAPNDPSYLDGTLWGLHNLGQNNGTADADIDAPEGWEVSTSASNVVVAVLDTGVRYTHEDLAPNMWVNPADGSHGWNALNGTNDPNDDNGHGTLVAGVLGAVGNNSLGVVGVAWQIQIMAGKCLDSAGQGSDSDLIECIDFARTNGAHIINASLDSASYSQALSNAIYTARNDGILFVASAGNDGLDVDLNPRYPAGYDIDNIIAATYSTRNDTLGARANYGATRVDLAAPGEEVWSTFFRSDDDYFGGIFIFGSSFAAPQVAGALALMRSAQPSATHQDLISQVLNATDLLPDLQGKCVSGGRLNLRNALCPPIRLTGLASTSPFQLLVSSTPNRQCVIEVTETFMTWSAVHTNTTAANGTFQFTDLHSTNSVQRFYRAVDRE